MAILKTFLCMCNTRTGSLISGCYTLAISLLCMVYYLFRYVGHKLVEDSAEYKGIIYVGFVLYGFMIVSSLVIIPGVQLDKRYLLLPWIYIVILVVLYDTGSVALLTTVHMERDETLQVSEILWVFFYLFRLAANCYCFTCVVSQYQELSDGRGTYDYFYKPRRRARLQNGNHFDIDTYDLPFGVHLPPYTEQDGTENNPPSYDKIYPNSDQSAAENSSSANNFVEIELNRPTHSNNDRYINHQLSMNDSGFIELNDQNEENGQRRQQRVENFSQRVENFSQRMENFSQGIENLSRGTENFNPESGASNLYTDSNVIDSLCSNHHHRTYHESQLCRYYGRRHSNADGNRYEVTVNIEWI